MDLGSAGLHEQPFRTHGRPLAVVSYASQRDALKALEQTRDNITGLCLIQGPKLSGKSILVREFVEQIPQDFAVAVVDGAGLNTAGLLETVLRQFGYVLDYNSTSELLAMLRVFAMQQAASHEPPILVIENTHALDPSALRTLAELAELSIRGVSALKMVLVSDQSLRVVIDSENMASLRKRVTRDFHLGPMTGLEVSKYIHAKLRAAGSLSPEFLFPSAVCAELWRASGGWPGVLDRIALLALAKAATLPISAELIERPVLPKPTIAAPPVTLAAKPAAGRCDEPPKLRVTNAGRTLDTQVFDKPRMLIGRSDHNDIAIESTYISRHHALLVRHGNTTFLMDLNSTNGTFVNSKRVSNHVLLDNDVITIGDHRIKFSDPNATHREALDTVEFPDTIVMKSLDDMRRLLAQENTEIMPLAGENLPNVRL